ncbi:MAG: 2Fe-2S iron-sulfur cluster-binding protein [Sulfurimonas sp.]|nr:2Fe-2S iron-sulfur cluster-binding protein [Sulfurimonas sp.]MDQ7060623.1 2Fe-2S iron-sulfur cluster-binding protein [Sulfurimonas sp.]
MKIKLQRETLVEYEVDLSDATLLNVLDEIKTKIDPSLSFSSGCRSSICGSCSVRVNSREVLACSYKVQDGDVVEPLKNVPVIRDLVVEMDKALQFNAKSKAWLSNTLNTPNLTQDNASMNEVQSDCILCGACYSACPVYAVNSDFLGPFALTRVWKYVSDAREDNSKEKIDTIQANGVWDCTLCNECTLVCPQDISSKADIEMLRTRSVMAGHNDPNFTSFDTGFGFDGSPSF